ncbi:GGDEF domain-containing protein [Aliikangiella sp. IMCC44359]|uniref:GGDEF domain-containing protein n=1 Tax=Aliikangiella sp. IMCC44359 TaxID=3459125 RepID=UPI00403A8F17
MKGNSTSKVIGIESYRLVGQSNNAPVDITSLAIKLQQTLEITPLLQTFCHEAAKLIPCDSVKYTNEQTQLNYQTGQSRAHLCRYLLELEDETLGEIECTRNTPFSIKETEQIERLLSLLIYPLRNALLYQKAVAEAHRDPLTQINNRAAFDEALAREICSYKRHQATFSLMVIDIDHFKQVNDTYGHITGDNVLKAVAQTIRNTIRRSDEVFRYGGEEFVVILSNTEVAGARFIAERVRLEIKQLIIKNHEKIKVTASIGVSASNMASDVNDTLHHADIALYKAKEQGRNKVIVCP